MQWDEEGIESQEEVTQYETDFVNIPYGSNEMLEEESLLEEINDEEDESTDEKLEMQLKDTKSDILKIEKLSDEEKYLIDSKAEEESYNDEDSRTAMGTIMSLNEEELDEEEIGCQECGITVLSSYIDYHIEVMHSSEPLSCENCTETFTSKIALCRHKNENHLTLPGAKSNKSKTKTHFCPLCTKEYRYKKQLQDHIRSFHKRERNTECPICHKREIFN